MSSGGTVRVNLVHGFEVLVGGRVVAVPPTAQRLVAFIALRRRGVTRRFVAGNLWLEASEGRASANLRSALWRLQRTGIDVLDVSATHLGLDVDVDVDLRRAEAAASALVSSVAGAGSVASAGSAVAHLTSRELDLLEASWRGDLLPDWYDDWLLIERERFRQLRIHALEALCALYAARGVFAKAIDVGLAAVAAEPLRESAHRRVIEAHLREGNVCEARRQYEWCASLLRCELGVEPSSDLTALIPAALLPL